MAGQAVVISILADAAKAKTEIASVGDSANAMGDQVRHAGASMDELGEHAGNAASASAQVAGGFGDLGGALAQLPGPLGALGTGMEALGPSIMGVTGAADLFEAVSTKLGLAQIKSAAALVASKAAMLGSTVATYAMTTATAAFNAVAAINPFVLIIAGIVLLVIAIGLLVKNWDKVKTFLLALWSTLTSAWDTTVNAIKTAATVVGQFVLGAIKSAFGLVKDVFSSVLGVIKGIVSTFVSGVKGIWQGLSFLGSFIASAIGKVKSAVSDGLAKVVSFFSGLPAKIKGALGNVGSILLNVGTDIMNGLGRGLEAGVAYVKGRIQAVANLIPSVVRKALGISSPSKVMKKLGMFSAQGFADGFGTLDVQSSLTKSVNGLKVPTISGSVALSGAAGGSAGTVINVAVSADPTTDTVQLGKRLIRVIEDAYAATGRSLKVGIV